MHQNQVYVCRIGLNVSATSIGQMGLEIGWFPLGNGVCLIMKKVPSDSPIWQLKKRELLLPLSFLITKPIKLDLSNLHYGPHYKPHYRTQGCVIRENNITAPIMNPINMDTLVPFQANFNSNGSVRWCTSVYLNLFHWPMGKKSGNCNGVCRYVRAWSEMCRKLFWMRVIWRWSACCSLRDANWQITVWGQFMCLPK